MHESGSCESLSGGIGNESEVFGRQVSVFEHSMQWQCSDSGQVEPLGRQELRTDSDVGVCHDRPQGSGDEVASGRTRSSKEDDGIGDICEGGEPEHIGHYEKVLCDISPQ